MGQQILILALTGTHNPALPADLAQQLSKQGFEIRHACLSYQGHTTFAVGAPSDLARELAAAGHPSGITLETSVASDSVTLETVLEEVRAHHEAFRKFVAYEKKDDKAGKETKPRGKKEVPAEPPASAEGTGSAPPAPTEAGATGAPEDNPPPITSGDSSESQPTGNE